MKKQQQVKVTYFGSNEVEFIDIEFAVRRLNSFWVENKIIELLISGNILFTPFANYEIVK